MELDHSDLQGTSAQKADSGKPTQPCIGFWAGLLDILRLGTGRPDPEIHSAREPGLL